MTARATSRTSWTGCDRVEAGTTASVHVPAEELDRVPVHLAMSPLPTMFTLIRDALQDGRRGTPAAVRNDILSALRRSDTEVFAPMTGKSGWPTLLDGVRGPSESLDAALDRLVAMPDATLVKALDEEIDVVPTPEWDAVRRHPRRWLHRYVDALHRGWRGVAPLWRRSSTLLERERERVHAAVEHGVPASQLISELSPQTSLVDGSVRLSSVAHESRLVSVDDRGVTVLPIIASPRAGSLSTPAYVLDAGAYPLRDVWRAFDGAAPPPASLQALLGPQRSALLQRLDVPQAAGDLADAIYVSPSGITFHLRNLEAAGLVARVRAGRKVMVHRTSRGTQLLALYELP
jgi:DNA-binding transcriptional ArsR family regulator